MYTYFTNFPVISYLDNPAINLLASVKIRDVVKNNVNVFYPYVVKDGERPDHIAADYYGDARYSWLIYLANDIIDPYYQWPMPTGDFKKFIVKKYGTIEKATEQILFYRVNWYGDDQMLSPEAFDSITPSSRKKYWQPVVGNNNRVIHYVRKPIDYVVETNKILSLTVDSSTGLLEGERVRQFDGALNITASGYIKTILDDTTVILYAIDGEFTTTATLTKSYNTTLTLTVSEVNTLSTDIPSDELIYWSAVSAFDYESEINESRKHIRVIDRIYVDEIEKEMVSLL
jgi:hypothetical protein